MRLISNSETTTWLTCRRKYWFEYILDLEPREFSGPITKGILIHAALENYYAGKALGWSEEECRQEGLSVFTAALMKDGADMVDLGKTRALLMAYWDHWSETDDLNYSVYAVESKLKMDMTEDFALVGTIDLIFQDNETHQYWLVDHKSSYNFWSEEQADLSGQFVKYIILGRNAGLDIAGVMINQLRTRELKEGNDLFKRIYIKPTERKISSVARQHILVGQEIVAFRNGGELDDLPPIFDKFVCSNCTFRTLCDAYSNGGDIKYGIQQDFKTRTGYGYN